MEDELRQKNERTIWDDLASQYDNNAIGTFKEAYRLTKEAILEEVTSDSSVIEIGCGTGIVSLGIAPHVNKVIGVDLSPKMITQAENKAQINGIQNVTFRKADAYSLPFEDESFDVVLLTNLLHIVAEPASVLQEARRLLRPDGVLAAVTDCMAEPGPFKTWLQALGIRAMKLFGRIKYFHFFHKSDLKDLLNNNGFLIQKEAEFHNAPVNYYLTAIKED